MIKGDRKRKMRSSLKNQGTVPAFLLKTYEILENPEYEDIISWNRDGNAFTVKNLNEFSEKVLPKYFKHNNFASFVRQLNMYDFHKSRHENNENEFRHKLFKRGQKHLLSEIKRKIGEGHGHSSNQLVPASRDFSVDKYKKEAARFTDELGNIRRHHTDLEKVTKVIYTQNSQLLKENKLLWNELGKNKEKYEKKVEKLMMFIFSVMHQDNQLGPSEGRKSLTNAEMTQAFNEFTKDEQGKNLFDEAGNTTLPALPDNKGNDKLLQNISNYLEDKGNDSNLDSILNQFQKEDMSSLFKNQPDSSAGQFNLDDQQNVNPNADAGAGRRRSTRRRGAPTPLSTLPTEGAGFSGTPSKQVKTETPVEPLYNYQQNLMNAQAPINLMSNEPSEEALRREFPDFNLGLSRGPSYRDNDLSSLRAPQLIQQKSSNDFLLSSPKPFLNTMNSDNFEDKGANMDLSKNNSQGNELGQNFSPPAFMNNNNNQNTYNFGQPFDDSIYRT